MREGGWGGFYVCAGVCGLMHCVGGGELEKNK